MDPYYVNHFMWSYRLKKRLTQQQFADKLEITKQAVSAIEHYKTKVSYETINKFCEAFGYRLYFQTFKKPGPPNA